MSPILELVLLSLRGRVVRRLRMLRRPRQLIGFLVGLIYLGWVVLRPLLRGGFREVRFGPFGGTSFLADPAIRTGAQYLLALVLAVLFVLIWLFTAAKPALSLTEAEAHLLLPAPLTRRQVLTFTLLKVQPGLLLGALVMTVFSGSGSGLARLPRFATTWALLTLFDLHVKGISLLKARWREQPPGATRLVRSLAVVVPVLWWAGIILTLRAIVLALAGSSAIDQLGGRGTESAVGELLAQGTAAARSGPLHLLLAPFLALVAPVLGNGNVVRLGGALVLAAVLALHFEWIVRSRARFEEAALERARRQLKHHDRRRRFERAAAKARLTAPFALAATGAPEVAIYWKNLFLRGRTPLVRSLGWLAATLAAVTAILAFLYKVNPDLSLAMNGMVGGSGLMMLCIMPLFAGIFSRHDLRVDLLQVEVLRPWPVAGARLVAAEILAAATTGFALPLAGAGLVAAAALATALAGITDRTAIARFLLSRMGAATPPGVGLFVILASLLVAGFSVALLSVAVQNVAALLLPGWVSLGIDRRRGAAALGQRLLTGVGHLLALGLATIVPLIAVGILIGVLQGLLDLRLTVWELPLLAAAAAVPYLIEAWLLSRVGGVLWDRLDPSQEILETLGGDAQI